jgi:hypothetical protein
MLKLLLSQPICITLAIMHEEYKPKSSMSHAVLGPNVSLSSLLSEMTLQFMPLPQHGSMLSYIKGKITGFRNKIKILSSRAVYNYTI